MQLPNSEHATVAMEKLTRYLLNPDHPIGSKKTRFFSLMGYTQQHAQLLQSQLIEIASTFEVAGMKKTEHGTNFVIIGLLKTPIGNNTASNRVGN